MGIISIVIYSFIGLILFIIINLLLSKYKLSKLYKFIFIHIILMIIAGFICKISHVFIKDIFLSYLFLMIYDVIYHNYYLGRDFFDSNDKNVLFYILLIISGLFINYEFFNKVNDIFLSGEDLRSVFWFLSLIFIFKFFNDNKNISINLNEKKFMSRESILVSYVKLKSKYFDFCKYEEKDMNNLLYSIMIFENYSRSSLLRCFDNFKYRITGTYGKQGIMQVDSKKYISDVESIELVYKKICKLYDLKNNKKKLSIDSIISSYYKDSDNSLYVKYIFDIIEKF